MFQGLRTVVMRADDLEKSRLATVRDPFGIIVGIIENPHFKMT